MLEQALAKTVRIQLCSLQRIDVVVHFDVANAIVVYQSCHHHIEVSPHFRVAKVEQKARIFQHPFSMPYEEPVVRLMREQRLWPGDLRFEPQSGNHASLPDLIEK